jgi:tetratricopeptide (TPR) repeat protein
LTRNLLIIRLCFSGDSTYLVFACFSYPLNFIEFQILSILCLASVAAGQEPVKMRPVSVSLNNKSLIIVFIVIAGSTLYSLCKYQYTVNQWNKHSTPIDDKTIPELQTLYPALKHNALFVSVYGSILYSREYYSEAIPVLEEALNLYPNSLVLLRLGESYEKTGNDFKAIEAWETASYMKPSLFTPHYNLANLYFKQTDYGRAKQEANIILNKKIKTDHPKINRMKKEMQAILDCNQMINKTN